MRRIFKLFILLAAVAISLPSFGQGLKAFKLKNGLSVYIWDCLLYTSDAADD